MKPQCCAWVALHTRSVEEGRNDRLPAYCSPVATTKGHSEPGSRTPLARVTGGNTNRYTSSDDQEHSMQVLPVSRTPVEGVNCP